MEMIVYGFPSKLAALQVRRTASFSFCLLLDASELTSASSSRSPSSSGAGFTLSVVSCLPDISSHHLTHLDLAFPGEISTSSTSSRNGPRCSRSQESYHLHHSQTSSTSTSLPSQQELKSSRVQGRRSSQNAHSHAIQPTSASCSTVLNNGGERLEEGRREGGCSKFEQAYDGGEHVWWCQWKEGGRREGDGKGRGNRG